MLDKTFVGNEHHSATSVPPYMVAGTLGEDEQFDLRTNLAMHHFKWDPQIEDVSTLASFPLLLNKVHFKNLWIWAQKLSEELIAAEAEIIQRPELLRHLGLPRRLLSLLSNIEGLKLSPSAARVLRFDFHFTKEGWKLSEVNSDVPGGFSESTAYTQLMADHFPGLSPTGLPTEVLCQKLSGITPNPRIALLSAPGYMEDHQVISYIANCLQAKGCRTYLANPAQITWQKGDAFLETQKSRDPIDVIFKFFQSEWLPLLPKNIQWNEYFVGGLTPVTNPGIAVIGESKRLPLVWDNLSSPMTTWRSLLPETRSTSDVPWQTDDSWLLKTAYSNTGDSVSIREFLAPTQWDRVKWAVRLRSRVWLAQKRFEPIPLETPMGNLYPCLGVYTIDGKPAGIYGRLGVRQWVDYSAIDVPILVDRRATWMN